MIRVFHPYWKWEDFKNGLYTLAGHWTEQQEEEMTEKAKAVLCDLRLFEMTALKVIKEWKIAAEVNLTNPSRNHQAWIGQASCCYLHKIPEYITKYAWRLMTPEQQTEANLVADKVIAEWQQKQEQNGYAKKIFEY